MKKLNDANLIIAGADVALSDIRAPIIRDTELEPLVRLKPRHQRIAYVTTEGDDARLPDVAGAWQAISLDSKTVEQTARRRCRNMFESLATLSDIAQWYLVPEELAGRRYRGVCIVGAGHSLDREIELLEALRAHGVLIAATNTASTAVEPDVVGYLESNDFVGTVRPGVPVLSEITAYPLVGKHAWFQSLDPAFDGWAIDQRLMPIEIGPSVTSSLMSWAVAVGFRQIVLVGVDLGRDGGPRYSQRSPYADRVRNLQPVLLPKVGGGKIDSHIIFKDELEWFETYAKRRPPGVRLIDTAFAAAKRGFENTRLERVEFNEDVNPGERACLISNQDVRVWLETTRDGLIALRQAASDNDHWAVREGLRRHLFMDAMMYADLLRMEDYGTIYAKQKFMMETIIERTTEVISWI
jgi:hypothetical protein